jgi:hypothetical protein
MWNGNGVTMSFKEYKSSQLGAPVRAFLQRFKAVHSSGGVQVGLDPFIEPVRDNFGDKNAARVADRGTTIYASKLIFKVRLQKINLSKRRVDLDLEGDSYDISYILD